MVLLVQKFGGSSLTDLSKLEVVARKVKKYRQSGYQIVLVLSALKGETDRLIGLANLLTNDCPQREYDALLATGEQAATCLMVIALMRIGVPAQTLNALQAGIYGDGVYQRSSIEHIDTTNIRACLDAGVVPVITGFQAIRSDNAVTTLGRGGSDTTAVALAAALNADECQIYVDVQGIFTADPKIEPSARLIHKISIQQLLVCANLGAKVMQKRAVACAAKYRVPLRICPTFIEGPGTMVEYGRDNIIEKTAVMAVVHTRDQIVLQVSGLKALTADVASLYDLVGRFGCDIEHSLRQIGDVYQLDCLLSQDDYRTISDAFEKWFVDREYLQLRLTKQLVRVSLTGYALVKDLSVTQQILTCCAASNIPIRHLFAGDNQVSLVVDQVYTELLVRSLHQYFQLDQASATANVMHSDASVA